MIQKTTLAVLLFALFASVFAAGAFSVSGAAPESAALPAGAHADVALNGGGQRFYLKPASAVLSARRAGTTAAWDQLNKYFGLMQMPIITSRYWNMVHGTTPDEVRQDLEGMQTMRILGHNMAYFLKCREMGDKIGVPAPPQEPFVFTNFIH